MNTDTTKQTFLVYGHHTWGRGATLAEAARQCIKAGCMPREKVFATLVVGCSTAEMDEAGRIGMDSGSVLISIGFGLTPSELKRLKV